MLVRKFGSTGISPPHWAATSRFKVCELANPFLSYTHSDVVEDWVPTDHVGERMGVVSLSAGKGTKANVGIGVEEIRV